MQQTHAMYAAAGHMLLYHAPISFAVAGNVFLDREAQADNSAAPADALLRVTSRIMRLE